MMTLHTQEVNGIRRTGLLFFDAENDRNAFFFDFHGQSPGHTQAPGPSYRALFNDKLYHLSELHPKYMHHANFPRPEVKAFLYTPDGKWLQNCAVLVEQLEYPTHNMSGRESQCRYDQKSISDMRQFPGERFR